MNDAEALHAADVRISALALLLPFSPLAPLLGFVALPPLFFAVLGAMIVCYLGIIEAAKHVFYKRAGGPAAAAATAAAARLAPTTPA